MIPLWLYTLGTTLPREDGTKIIIPFVSILTSLAVILIPLCIGILVQYKLPKVAKVFNKGLKVSTVLINSALDMSCFLWLFES